MKTENIKLDIFELHKPENKNERGALYIGTPDRKHEDICLFNHVSGQWEFESRITGDLCELIDPNETGYYHEKINDTVKEIEA